MCLHVYALAVADTHCAYPSTNGRQIELMYVNIHTEKNSIAAYLTVSSLRCQQQQQQ